MEAAVIIPCAGSGTRMGAKQNKIFLPLGGYSIIYRTVSIFYKHPDIKQIIIACKSEDEAPLRAELAVFAEKLVFCQGGATRCETVYNALQKVPQTSPLVLIHDAVRPFVTSALIDACIAQCACKGSAVAAVPVKDTVKRCENGVVTQTLNREELYQIQTPQTFLRQEIINAYNNASWDGATDDAQVYERAGYKAHIILGDYKNIKLTTAEDMAMANAFLGGLLRTGMGFDVHAFAFGRKLILGGVEIPYEKGLLGHSDADVLTHAVMDALLGAAALGDIGKCFPDTDNSYKDINSLILLERVYNLLCEKGFEIVNIDATVIAQAPKLAPYIDTMRQELAKVLKTDIQRISIKATTTERLGFTGRKEGIAAQCVANVLQNL